VVGQWARIGDRDRKADNPPRMTNNARFEELAQKVTYRGPWERGQRCLTRRSGTRSRAGRGGVHVSWRFRRRDGDLWGLAGLYNQWTDPVTGEIVPSYTMVTLNCDGHPLLSRMHKPHPKLPPDRQDKRTVVLLEPSVWGEWLAGSVDEARALMQVAVEVYEAGPATRA
jgi:putative SOS response-associated peptidase YedK